jgi:hypothetical protein
MDDPSANRPENSALQDEPWLRRYAQILGYLGWTPLPALALLAWISPERTGQLLRVALLYSAVILSFLGGIQWGLAMRSASPRIRLRRLVASMVPSLWAVAALLLPVMATLTVLITGFALFLAYESLERRDQVYPDWYLPLRIRLTVLLIVALSAWLPLTR